MTIASIIIRCCNEEKYIGRLLEGIQQQSVKDVENIVVDSGSTDSTISIAQKYNANVINIDSKDFSFGRALNVGCEIAKAPYLVFVSAHVYPLYSDWLENMIRPFTNEKVALVYGKQRGDDSTRYSEHRIFTKWYPNYSTAEQHHPFCNNANAAVRKSLWKQMPYDESLTGLEDLDWANKAINEGYCLSYVSEAEIVHVHNERYNQIFRRYMREAITFKKVFPKERFNLYDFTKLLVANIAVDYYHAALDHVLLKEFIGIPLFRFVQLYGTYMGYKMHRPVTRYLRDVFYYPTNSRIHGCREGDCLHKIVYSSEGK